MLGTRRYGVEMVGRMSEMEPILQEKEQSETSIAATVTVGVGTKTGMTTLFGDSFKCHEC